MRHLAVLLVTSLLSLLAFADTYSGSGSYKTNSGYEGDYSVVASIEEVGDLVAIYQTIDFSEEVLNLAILLQKTGENFYDVLDADTGEVVGSGYCWDLEGEDMICHSYSHHDDYVFEISIKKHGDYLYRIGSKTDLSSGEKVIWKDSLQKQE